jgi:hypothetical protein
MKIRSWRTVAAAAAAATVATVGGFALSTSPAFAGAANRVTTPAGTVQAAAGTCQVIDFSLIDALGERPSVPATFTVTLTEGGTSDEQASQDVDFCSIPGVTAPTEEPSYISGDDVDNPPSGSTQSYAPGPGVTGNGFSSGDNPDAADSSAQSTSGGPSPFGCDCTNTNPSGVDRARYTWTTSTTVLHVGVVGLKAGSATVSGFLDNKQSNGITCSAGGDYAENCSDPAADVTFNISAGGQPGSNDTAVAVAAIDLQPTDSVGAPGANQTLTATLRNSSGNTIRGVTPRAQVSASGANPLATPTCTESDNNGVSVCTFKGTNPGTDQLTVWVQRSGGTAGIDGNEISRSVTVKTTFSPVAATEARYIDMTPRGTTFAAGKPATFTATVTDVNGAPAQGVSVVFTESGPGQFPGGASSVSATTDATGRAFVGLNTTAGSGGSQTVTGTINTPNTQCTQLAGSGNGASSTTPGGRCADTTSVTIIGGSPSPSPSPSSTSSGPRNLTLGLDSPSTITPGVNSLMTARGNPNGTVILRCYSRTPDNANQTSPAYTDARTGTLSSSGSLQFTLHPGTNTRCFVKYSGTSDSDTRSSPSIVQNVATALSLSAYRDGVRRYHFQGTNLPRRSGQLITLYRYATGPNLDQYCVPFAESYTSRPGASCTAVRTATAVTNSTNVWRIDRTFTGSGRFYFVARTSQTLTNVAGFSNQRLTIIH